DIVDPPVVSGRWTLSAAVAEESSSSAVNRIGWPKRACGRQIASRTVPATIIAVTKMRAGRGRRFIGESVDAFRRRHLVIAPVLFQQRPEHLIEIRSAAPNRAAQHALLNGADFPQRGVRTAVRQQDTRFKPMGAERC